LRARAKIDFYEYGTGKGYQRVTADKRGTEISRFILQHEGILPTAVLVNIRSKDAKFTPDEDMGGSDLVTGTLEMPEDEPWWVVDGQNRLKGLHKAAEEKEKTLGAGAKLDYDLPVVFTLAFDLTDEMRMFFVVNSSAKSVPTDLTAKLIQQAVQREGLGFIHSGKGTEKDLRKAAGAAVAEFLNNEEDGPWEGKIRLPNETTASRKAKPLQLNAIASSLEPFLRTSLAQQYIRTEIAEGWPTLCELVSNYWSALSELMPEAFDDIENHSIQRTSGTYSFNMILPEVMELCSQKQDYSVAALKGFLSPLGEWVDSGTWRTDDTGRLETKSTGMSSLRALADQFVKVLPTAALPGLKRRVNLKRAAAAA
jgi:DGQHR domain-containing protein